MRERYIIRRKQGPKAIEYWTGTNWSTMRSLAKSYHAFEAREVIEKRFWRQAPMPHLVDNLKLRASVTDG